MAEAARGPSKSSWSRWLRFKSLPPLLGLGKGRTEPTARPEETARPGTQQRQKVVPSGGVNKEVEKCPLEKEEEACEDHQVCIAIDDSEAGSSEPKTDDEETESSEPKTPRWEDGASEADIEKHRARKFFKEMEKNIHRNLEQGLLVADVVLKDERQSVGSRRDSFGHVRARFTLDDSFVDEVVKKDQQHITRTGWPKDPHQGTTAGESSRQNRRRDSRSENDDGGEKKSSENATKKRDSRPELRRSVSHRPALVKVNSTGRLHVDHTLHDPDVKATIQCVSRSILALISQPQVAPVAAPRDEMGAPSSSENKTPRVGWNQPEGLLPASVFQDDEPGAGTRAPTLQEMTKFVRNVYTRGEMHVECLVAAFIYIERLLKAYKGTLGVQASNWRPVVFSTMILASKVCDDESPVNADWCYVCPSFTVKRINHLELALLTAFQFKPTVAASHYAKYYFHFRSMAARLGLIAGDKIQPLDVAVAKRIAEASKSVTNPHNPSKHKDAAVHANRTLGRQRSSSFCELTSLTGVSRRAAATLEQLVDMDPDSPASAKSGGHPFLSKKKTPHA